MHTKGGWLRGGPQQWQAGVHDSASLTPHQPHGRHLPPASGGEDPAPGHLPLSALASGNLKCSLASVPVEDSALSSRLHGSCPRARGGLVPLIFPFWVWDFRKLLPALGNPEGL